MTKEERLAKIARLEHTYGRNFLERSLHGVALQYRSLTAPNAAERDEPSLEQSGSGK